MYEREQTTTVNAVAIDYAHTIRYLAALHFKRAQTRGQKSDDQAEMVRMVESFYLIMVEGYNEDEAELIVEERCDQTPLSEHVRRVNDEEERRRFRDYFLTSSARGLAYFWSDYKNRRVSVEELEEVFARSPEDPERQKLIEWVPGDERELSEVLSRRSRSD